MDLTGEKMKQKITLRVTEHWYKCSSTNRQYDLCSWRFLNIQWDKVLDKLV